MLDQHAHQEEHGHGDQERDDRIDAEPGREEVADVHSQHHELALGEIHDLHDAEDERDADAHERIDAPDEQAVDDGLRDDFHHEVAPTLSTGAPGHLPS